MCAAPVHKTTRSPRCQVAGVVTHGTWRDVHRLPAGKPDMSAAGALGKQIVANRGWHLPWLDDGIPGAEEPAREGAPQRRVDGANSSCIKQSVATLAGVGQPGSLLEQRGLGVVGSQRQRSVRPEAGAGHDRRQLLPQLPGA